MNRKDSLTIKDVARLAGVSPAAVSIALNNRKGVSTATRERILQVVRDTGFVPNQQARRLLFKRTGNIGVLHEANHSPLANLFLLDILRSIVATGEELGYTILLSVVPGEGKGGIPDLVRRRDVDGLIVIGEVDLVAISEMDKAGLPLILVDEHLRYPHVVAVEADYRQGARTAVQYLLGTGHRAIAYMGEPPSDTYGRQTLEGYREALVRSGIKPEEMLIATDVHDAEEHSGYRSMQQLLSRNLPFTAVFCSADIYALGAMRALREAGRPVPGDISVMGMDDILLSRYVEPGLATVRFSKDGMGETAVHTLVRMIDSTYEGPRKIMFRGEIVHRASVATGVVNPDQSS